MIGFSCPGIGYQKNAPAENNRGLSKLTAYEKLLNTELIF